MTPILYVKRGCPHCKVATDYLDERSIKYQVIDVRTDASQMQKLKRHSGQSKTPTLDWDGAVRADFGSLNWSLFCATGQPLQRHDRATRRRSLRQTH